MNVFHTIKQEFTPMKHYSQAAKLAATIIFFTLALVGFNFLATAQAASPHVAITEHPHKPSELLIKYKPGISTLQGLSVAQRFGVIKIKSLTRSRCRWALYRYG